MWVLNSLYFKQVGLVSNGFGAAAATVQKSCIGITYFSQISKANLHSSLFLGVTYLLQTWIIWHAGAAEVISNRAVAILHNWLQCIWRHVSQSLIICKIISGSLQGIIISKALCYFKGSLLALLLCTDSFVENISEKRSHQDKLACLTLSFW